MSTTYEVRVAGHLEDHWAGRMGGFELRQHPDGTSTLSGEVVDQAHLHGVLAVLRDIGAPLVSLRTVTPE